MKTGAEPKKVAILAALLVIGGVVLYFNVFAGDSDSRPAPVRVAPVVAAPALRAPVAAPPGLAVAGRGERRRTSGNAMGYEFKFRQGTPPGEDKPDPASIDPTLRLDLLAKLQQVEPPASMRNIFQYGAAPPPPDKALPALPSGVKRIPVTDHAPPPPPSKAQPPAAPAAPAMTFKYYGYKVSKRDGRKEAFLLDGEDIIIAGENDSVKLGRYKVVRIGVSSITIEDTQFKSTQTLQLQPDPSV